VVPALLSMPDVLPLWNWVNDYMVLLYRIDQNAPRYLYRYMQTSDPGVARIARGVAELMCAAVETYGNEIPSDYDQKVVVKNLVGPGSLLMSLLAMSPSQVRDKVLTPKIKATLFPAFAKYCFYQEKWVAESLIDITSMLSDQLTASRMHDFCKRAEGKSSCRRRLCSKTCENAQLFECGRCHTVLYCSKKHQVEDWDDLGTPHKAMCYPTPW